MYESETIRNSLELEDKYKVKLEVFEGPLDLLLHLIKQNELDISDIPISIITRQYLEYLNIMKELNLEIAGEFLVMASTLLQIKSRMLLPASPVEDDTDQEEEDPRSELIRRLIEYKKYKDASTLFENMEQTGRDVFTCKVEEPDSTQPEPDDEIVEVEIFELIKAFRDVLARAPVDSFHEVLPETISVAERITEILSLLQEKQAIRFEELFPADCSRVYKVANFLAILELCKLKMTKIVQSGLFGEIWITPAVSSEEVEETRGEDSSCPT